MACSEVCKKKNKAEERKGGLPEQWLERGLSDEWTCKQRPHLGQKESIMDIQAERPAMQSLNHSRNPMWQGAE